MKNPPAFPQQFQGTSEPSLSGLTMRDYFAAKAMQVILQSHYEDGVYVNDIDNDSEIDCAESAYIMADAMMKARQA
jgi:hypothetical protein